MKRINFNIKDRKVLTLGLCLVAICVFTLTIAYAALNAILTISGNAEVIASDWNIYLANPKVTNGSVSDELPVISNNSTLSFNVELNLPGDFYEFTVDVINDGTIDAMIDSVSVLPRLSTEQSRYLIREVTYANGENISSKQLLEKKTKTSIKVRIEYKKDIGANVLPFRDSVINFEVSLLYIQSDGTGTSVPNNGVGGSSISANGSLDSIGTIVTIGDQQFYTIGTEGDNVKLLSMYNLYVGGIYNSGWIAYGDEATGKQDSTMLGYVSGQSIPNGTTAFSNTNSTYAGSIVEGYVNNYKTILEEDYGVDVVEARLISYDELTDSETFACVMYDYCSDKYPWIYSTSYWSGSAYYTNYVWLVYSNGYFDISNFNDDNNYGVRPVIIISKDYFN